MMRLKIPWKTEDFRKLIIVSLFTVFFLSVIIWGGYYYFSPWWRERKVQPLLLSADEAFQEKSYTEAGDLYHQVQLLSPRNYQAYAGLSRIYLLKGQTEEAVSLLNDFLVIADSSDQSFVRKSLAEIYLDSDEFNLALDILTPVSDDDTVRNYLLIKSYFLSGDRVSGGELVERLVLDPCNQVYLKLIDLLANSELKSLSAEEIISLTASEECHLPIDILRDEFLSLLDIQEDYYQQAYQASLLSRHGFYFLAEEILESVVSNKPTYRDAHALLATCYLQRGELSLAEDSLDLALGLDRDYAYAHYLYGRLESLSSEEEKIESAKSHFRLAVDLDWDNDFYIQDYLELLSAVRDYGEMERFYQEILNRDTLSEEDRNNYIKSLGYLYLDHLYEIQKGLVIAKEFPQSELYAWALYKNDQWLESRYLLEKLLLEEETAWRQYRYGKVLTMLEDVSSAENAFARALDLDLSGEVTALIKN